MPVKSVFQSVPTELDFPRYEANILRLWQDKSIFEKSLETPADAPDFVFYEGPPTANGVPHNGHVLTRVMKDLFPRYKSMCGYRVLRKGGWDTVKGKGYRVADKEQYDDFSHLRKASVAGLIRKGRTLVFCRATRSCTAAATFSAGCRSCRQ